jgi:PKD repeat protein
MAFLQATAGGKLLTLDAGKLAEECCCGPSCCDDPGGPPVADFTWIQTSDDPCSFDFTDTSTAGTCGAIVSGTWYFGDGDTSTATDPSHTYDDAGPWTVTRTVVDSSGCEHSVSHDVPCNPMTQCTCCDDEVPDTILVELSDFAADTPPTDDCPACVDINGVYEATNPGGAEGADCTFYYEELFFCGDFGSPATIKLSISVNLCTQSATHWVVTVLLGDSAFGYAQSWQFRLTKENPCRGVWSIPLFSNGGASPVCDTAGTLTLTI